MGLRQDLDKSAERYVYYLINNEDVLYVGTTKKPHDRYKNHLKKIKENNPALIYAFCNKHNIIPQLKIVSKFTSTYKKAEIIEIEHINKNNQTCLNFYNNDNKERYYAIKESLNL